MKRAKEVGLRSKPENKLTRNNVKIALIEHNLFDSTLNKGANGIENEFIENSEKKTIKDKTTGLIWQQSGSADKMLYQKGEEHIIEINKKRFAGYNNWRLPTVEEAMSLMEPEKKNNNLHISKEFDKEISEIWTADKDRDSYVWRVNFNSGNCDTYNIVYSYSFYVHAVRDDN